MGNKAWNKIVIIMIMFFLLFAISACGRRQITQYYTVTFSVMNVAGGSVAGAIIQLGDMDPKESDENGSVTFDKIEEGSYTYKVAKDGFEQVEDQVLVDQDVVVDVVLKEIPTFNVNFVVQDENGYTIDDATITLDGVTKDAGVYLFEGLEAGSYDYSIYKTGYFKAEGSVEIIDRDVVELVTLELITYVVTFAIEDELGEEIEDAVVTLDGVMNEAGEYRFEGLAPGLYEYSVEKEGYKRYEGEVEVVDSDVTECVVLEREEVEEYYTVTFAIEDELGEEIEGAVVTLDGAINEAGEYRFEGIAPGLYEYSVEKEGYKRYEGEVEVVDVDVTERVVLEREEVEEYYTITFTIEDELGEEIEDAVVTLDGAINEAGEYSFEGLAPGLYEYSVEKEGYKRYEGEVEVVDSDVTERVVLEREEVEEYYTITFAIEDELGEEIEDAVVTLDGAINEAGDYRFEGIAPGLYVYSVEKEGYKRYEGEVEVVDSDVTERVVLEREEVEEYYTVTFAIEDELGEEIEDAVVTLDGVVNEAGDYVFKDVKSGVYDYSVAREGYEYVEGRVDVIDTDVTERVVLVEVIRTYKVMFEVTDDNEPASTLENATITVYFDVERAIQVGVEQITDEMGIATLDVELEDGTYYYTVSCKGFIDIDGEFTIDGADKVVDVAMSRLIIESLVSNADQLEEALADIDIDIITFEADIEGEFELITAQRDLIIQGEGHQLLGELVLGDGSEDIVVHIDELSIVETLIIDVGQGSVYFTSSKVETIEIESIGSGTLTMSNSSANTLNNHATRATIVFQSSRSNNISNNGNDSNFNFDDNSGADFFFFNASTRVTGANTIGNATVNSPGVSLDKEPGYTDGDYEPDVDDKSRFDIKVVEEQIIAGIEFNLDIANARDKDGDSLEGDKHVRVIIAEEEEHIGIVTFTSGDATSILITFEESGEHTLRVAVEDVTSERSTTITVKPADEASVTVDDIEDPKLAGEPFDLAGSISNLVDEFGNIVSDGKYRVIVTSDQADKEVFNDEVSFVDGKPDGSIIIELGTAASHILAVEIGAVQDSTTVVVESGSPATLSVTANPTTLTAGGNQVSTITALVTDSNSNPIEGVTVFFTSNGSGSIDPSSGVTDVSGKAVTTYTTAFGDDGSVVTVTAIEQENENANTIGITVKSPLPPPPPPPVPAPSARVGNVTVDGIVGSEITARDVVVTVFNDRFWAIGIGANLASWITNLPDGLDAKAKGAVIEGASQVTIKITGTPAEALKAAVSIKIPHTNLQTSVTDLAVTANADAKFEVIVPESIVTNERSGLSYETLQAAIDVAQIDDTLVFLTDSKESNVEITKPLTINFGDNTLIGNLTITDAVEGTVNLRGNIAAPPAYHLTGTLTDNKSGGATNNSLRIQGASPSIIITGSGVFTEDAEGNRVKVDSLTFEGITITSNASGLTLEVSAGTTLPRLIIEAGASSTRITNHGKINKFSNGSVDTIYGGKNPDEITGETLSRVPLAVGGVEEITVSNAEAGATVTLYDSDDNSIDTETADSSGEAIFTGVPAGTGYYVTQTVSGGESASSNTVVVDSNAKAITAFDFEGLDPTVVGTVDEGAKTVALTVPFGTDVTALVPTIMHTGASVAPNTGVAQDFSSSVTYTVTAADASMQDYVVTVNGVPEPAPEAETLTPLTDATGLAVDTIISILFDRDVTEMDFTGIKVEWDDDGTPTAIGIDTTPPALDGRTITITPNDNLAEETEYTVTIPEDAVENDDEVGNAEITWSFTTIQPAPENGVGPNSIIGSIPMNGNNSPGRSFDLRASKQRDVFIQNNNGPEYEVWVVPFIIGNASVLQEGTVNEHSVKFPVNDEGEFTVDIDLIDETLADVFVLILLDLSQTFRKDQLQGVVTLLSGDADLVMFPLDRIDGVVDLGALTIEDGFARSTNTLDYNSGSFTGGIDDLLDLANLDNYGTLVINDFVNENSSNSFYTSGTTLEFDFYEPQHNVPPSLDDYNWVQMELWMYSHDSTSTVEFHRPSGPLLDTLDNFGSGGLVKWGYNAPLDAPDRFDPFPGWYRATGSDRDFYLNYDLVLVKDNADKPILPTPRPTFTLDEDGIVTQMDISWSYRDANGVERDITDLTLLNRIIRNGVINVNYVNGNWCHFSFSADDSYVSFTDRWVLGSPDIERVVFHFGFGAFSCSFRLNFSQRSERAAANAEQLKEFLGQDNPKITTILIVEDFDLEEDLTVKNENTIIHLNDKTLGGDHTLTIEGENTTIKGGTLDLNVDVNTDVTFDGVTIGDDTITIAAGATLTFDGAQSIVGDATFVFTDRRATIAGAVNVNKNLVATMGYDNQVVDNKLHFTMGKELAIGQNVVINSNDIPLGDVTNEGLYANGVTDNAVLDGAAQADIITVQIVNVALAAGQTIEVNVELTANGEWEVVYNGVTFQTVGVPEAGFSASAPAEPTEGEIFNVTIEDAINDLFTDVEGEVNVTITSDNTDEGTEGVVYEDDATFTIGDATISIILNEIGTQILTIEIAGVTPTETVNVDVQENGVRPNSINGRLQPGSSENIESFRNVKNKIIRDADFSITPLGNNYSPYAEHKIWVVPIVRGNDSFIEEGSVWSYKTECNVQDDGSFELDIENLIQVYHQTVEDYVLLLIDETQEDRKDQVVSFITLSSDQLGDIVMMPLAEMKGNLNLGNVTVSSEEKTASSGLTLEDNETAFSTVGMDSIQQMARYQNLGRLVINDYINYHNENDKHSLDMMLVFRSNDEGRGALTRRDSIDYNDIEFENAEIRLYTTSKDSSFDLVLPDNTKAYGNCAGDGAVRWYWLVTQNDFSQEGWWNVETDESALAEFDFGLAVVRDQAGYPVAPVPVVEFEYGDQGQITSMAYKWHIDGEPLSDLALLERLFNRGEVEIQYTRRDDDNTVTIVDKELLSYQFSGGGIDIPVEQTGDILHIYFRFAAYRVVYEFSVEESIKVTGIEVTKQPTNLSYDEGEKLDLEGLEVTLTWSDTNTTVVGYADFGIHGLTAVPAHGTELTFIDYNGNPVTITHTQSEESDETQALTVTQVTVPAAPTTVTLNMQTGVTVNTLTTHEYSVDGGGSWTAFESDNEVLGAPVLAILSAAKDFQVRVAADGGAPAGAVHTIIINAAEPLATPVAGAIADGITITGLTNNAIYLYNPNNTGWRLGTASAGGELTNAGNALAVGESVLLRIISANDQAAATAHTVTRVSKAPEFNSAEVTNEVPSQLRVTFDVNVEVSDGVGEGGFSVGVTTPPAISISVDSVELADGYTVVLNLSRPVEYGDVITVSYDKNSGNIVSAVYSLEAQSFTDQEVNNKVLQSSQ